MKSFTLAVCVLTLPALSGCAMMSGYDNEFACPQVEYGTPCMSATEVYHQSGDLSSNDDGRTETTRVVRHVDDDVVATNDLMDFRDVAAEGVEEVVVVKKTTRPDYRVNPRQSPPTSGLLPGFRGAKPVRTPAQVMRIYIAPWVSTDGALTMAQYVFTEITPRTWTIGERAPAMGTRHFYPLQVRRQNTGTGRDMPNVAERGEPRK